MGDEELLKLYEKYINPPFPNYSNLAIYAKEKFNVEITPVKLRSILLETFHDISQIKINNRKEYMTRLKENRPKKEKKFNGTQKKIIELASEGKLQHEIGEVLNINQSYVSRIVKRSGLEIAEIKKTRILVKLEDFTLDDMKDVFYEIGSLSSVLKWCQSLELNITLNDLIFIYDDILHLKKFCSICSNEMELTKRGYCSKKCSKEARRDSVRTQQFNRRVKGGGKTTQSVSRRAKIKEANGICYLCKEKLNGNIKDKYHPLYIVIDHVEALTYSNDTSTNNLRAVCRCCNTLKQDKPAHFYKEEEYKQNRKIKAKEYVPKTNNFDIIDKDQFIIDCKNGMTIKKLCDKYNRSTFVISKMKKELDIAKQIKERAKIDPEETLLQVVELTEQGKKIYEIANSLGIAVATVSWYKRKAFGEGLLEKQQRTVIYNDFLLDQVSKLTKEGKTIKQIMEILDIPQSTVSKYRKEAYQKGILKRE